MAWTQIKLDIRNRLAEPNAGFWSNKELQDWYNDGVALQHRAVFQMLIGLGGRSFEQVAENEYLKLFMALATSNLVAGTQDYALPTGFWRALRVTVKIDGVHYAADYVPWSDDWQVRLLAHMAPSPYRPKYTIRPDSTDSKLVVYMNPGDNTIPNGTNEYKFHYLKQPARVDLENTAPGTQDTEVADPFNLAPMAHVCARAMKKQYQDDGPYIAERDSALTAIVPGPSREAAEIKG